MTHSGCPNQNGPLAGHLSLPTPVTLTVWGASCSVRGVHDDLHPEVTLATGPGPEPTSVGHGFTLPPRAGPPLAGSSPLAPPPRGMNKACWQRALVCQGWPHRACRPTGLSPELPSSWLCCCLSFPSFFCFLKHSILLPKRNSLVNVSRKNTIQPPYFTKSLFHFFCWQPHTCYEPRPTAKLLPSSFPTPSNVAPAGAPTGDLCPLRSSPRVTSPNWPIYSFNAPQSLCIAWLLHCCGLSCYLEFVESYTIGRGVERPLQPQQVSACGHSSAHDFSTISSLPNLNEIPDIMSCPL